jgi:hypothetical protein
MGTPFIDVWETDSQGMETPFINGKNNFSNTSGKVVLIYKKQMRQL